ncbi:four-carbon acid sugar kinase family protein [Paenibacillus algorifonticola]|uniref:four-carbon acid sugar kinase family protein n=1 Tax=Paenibacillus algorifonticola TaxID=684063 RepID=UPI003D2DAF1C
MDRAGLTHKPDDCDTSSSDSGGKMSFSKGNMGDTGWRQKEAGSGSSGDRLPAAQRLLSYYGDDFTGSTDVLEALFRAGLRAALFLEPPSEQLLARKFADLEAIGVAGIGRSLTPEEAERELRPVLEQLRKIGSAITHYKICSTFDSSAEVGSIGKAAEIGRSVFGSGYVPILAGVPYLGRYTLFGNHFAAAGGEMYRLDRHPTMSRHPITPMAEADLRQHLAQQTDLKTALMDILALEGDAAEVGERLAKLVEREQPDLVLFDVLDEARLAAAGQLIWAEAQQRDGLFAIGSSGVEYALGACWRKLGLLQEQPESSAASAAEVERLLVVSGSCSPVTEQQIKAALAAGFAGVRVPAEELLDGKKGAAARQRLLKEAREKLADGRSLLLYSAEGVDDPGIPRFRETLAAQGYGPEQSSRLLGALLGALARELIIDEQLTRIVIAGGDTSGYVTRGLGIYALECVAALTPGAPLCRAFSEESALDGLELVLKGGQIGERDFFTRMKQGRTAYAE